MRPLDPRLLRYARATRAFLALTVGLGVAGAVLVVAQASLLATGIASVFLDGAVLSPALIAGLAGTVVARAAVVYAQERAAARAAAAAKSQLRSRLLPHLVALGPGGMPGRRTGELSTLTTRGLDALDAYFARYLPQLVLAAVIPVVMLARLFPADLIAAVTILVTLPLIPIFMALVGLHTQAANRRQFRLLTRLSHHFLDVVAGLTTLKVFGRAAAQAATIRRVSDDQRRVTMRTLRIAFLSTLVLELVATLSVALVAVGVGLRLLEGDLDLATALLVLILAPEAYLPLRQVGVHYHAAAEGLAAAEETFAVLDTPLPGYGGDAAPPPGPAGIELSGLVLRHPGRDRPAVEDLTARIRPGEIVALTGPSGCGKSTVLAALLGFHAPAAGRIAVGGADLAGLDLAAWRERLAWVPQRPHLLAASVADNIRLGRPGATEAEVRAAAEAAGADRFITALPGGYDSVLGDDGAGVSAGQRQRIALARAFLRDAPVVLLDEPTANLDDATAAEVQASIRRLARGRTVVLAAHRPELIALADREIRLGASGKTATTTAVPA
ncbi:thiol reductant ABC exporter subunit CydD [Actinoplanes sp. NPDC023936]|uniref:thiol reductant ABC exporter subunit CydD n=1 Tax=Actinoplanes sp. NPDC023936 TaxID=3154910 RepID=UPI0033CAADF7